MVLSCVGQGDVHEQVACLAIGEVCVCVCVCVVYVLSTHTHTQGMRTSLCPPSTSPHPIQVFNTTWVAVGAFGSHHVQLYNHTTLTTTAPWIPITSIFLGALLPRSLTITTLGGPTEGPSYLCVGCGDGTLLWWALQRPMQGPSTTQQGVSVAATPYRVCVGRGEVSCQPLPRGGPPGILAAAEGLVLVQQQPGGPTAHRVAHVDGVVSAAVMRGEGRWWMVWVRQVGTKCMLCVGQLDPHPSLQWQTLWRAAPGEHVHEVAAAHDGQCVLVWRQREGLGEGGASVLTVINLQHGSVVCGGVFYMVCVAVVLCVYVVQYILVFFSST